MMNLQELETIQSNQLVVKIFVLNNDVYGVIRRRQHDLFRGRTIGVDGLNGVTCPEFNKVADAFGFTYRKITSVAQFESEFNAIVDLEESIICEVMTNLSQDYIELGHGRNKNKKVIRKPLEDQKPFLETDLLEKEMIIETLGP